MPWTLKDLMSESTTVAKLTPEDINPSRASFYVNQAQRDVANRIQQLEYERVAVSSTSSGDDKVFLPTDCERVLVLSFDTGGFNRVIPQTSLDVIDSKSNGTLTGLPEFWASYASWVQFYPSPNSSYSLQLRYVARLSDMTNYDAIPSVDTRYHQGIMFKTVEFLTQRKGDLQSAAVFRALYEQELRNQPSVTAQRQMTKAGMGARVQLSED